MKPPLQHFGMVSFPSITPQSLGSNETNAQHPAPSLSQQVTDVLLGHLPPVVAAITIAQVARKKATAANLNHYQSDTMSIA